MTEPKPEAREYQEKQTRRMVDLDPAGLISRKAPDQARRQFLNYAFFKLDPAFRRLGRDLIETAKAEFAGVCEEWAGRGEGFILRSYSLVGLRSDVDFMLWRIGFGVDDFQAMQRALNRTALAGYLSQPFSFLSMQKRSIYVDRFNPEGEGVHLLPGQGDYLFVYPFVKTRPWYDLSPQARQGMMDEHIYVSAPFTGVTLNTSYSYGIDDQEFVVAFDSNHPQEFVDLVQRLRFTEASQYTLRDTPMFTCAKKDIREILEDLA
ncbi:chlorite dismutase family protein [uncultured Meiothermus sp.]|jgi:chlorite dismutase|uniref:chlorite dismutase family protein n=1 Tax=uncultured Meiothermus sp. TaxID=157471 RepID=UPI002639B212|nr:chlorite dismutase family protein [uncultured Meiothermus sp.]